jgi:hypothetical protein
VVVEMGSSHWTGVAAVGSSLVRLRRSSGGGVWTMAGRWHGRAVAPPLSGGREAPPPPSRGHRWLFQAVAHAVVVCGRPWAVVSGRTVAAGGGGLGMAKCHVSEKWARVARGRQHVCRYLTNLRRPEAGHRKLSLIYIGQRLAVVK